MRSGQRSCLEGERAAARLRGKAPIKSQPTLCDAAPLRRCAEQGRLFVHDGKPELPRF
jgi:hypothetical protein